MVLLDYHEMKNEIIQRIELQKYIVLATCYNQRVTARTIYYVNDGLDIYFLTSKAYLKYKQIEKNLNVALCFDNMQMEGESVILGNPSTFCDEKVLGKIQDFNEMAHFLKYKNTVLIKVCIKQIEMWKENERIYFEVTSEQCYSR